MKTIKIYGSSDDIISIMDGDMDDEFNPRDETEESILRFNDGTSLAIHYDSSGCWRIRCINLGEGATNNHMPAIGPDSSQYSDIVNLSGTFNNVRFINN